MNSPKDLSPSSESNRESPPLIVASLNLKTVINHKQNVNEVAAVSVVVCKDVKVLDFLTLNSTHFLNVFLLMFVSFHPKFDVTFQSFLIPKLSHLFLHLSIIDVCFYLFPWFPEMLLG